MNRRTLLTSTRPRSRDRSRPPGRRAAGNTSRRQLAPRPVAIRRPKYPSGFKQFDYVNANAPKGGTVRQIALGTYDNFNMAVAGVKGSPSPAGSALRHASRPAARRSFDGYGLIAEAVSYPDDFSAVTYRLRAEAQWHDGKPVTPDDVIFSFNSFKKYNPQYAALLPSRR